MPQDNPLATRLAESGFLVVAIADPLLNIPSILVNDAEGARLLAEHLQQRGHRRLLYLNSLARPVSAVRRRDAFLQVAAQSGMEVEEACCDSSAEGDNALVTGLLRCESANRPTAIACWNDQTAYDVLADCRLHHLRVPDDIAVVGFDGASTPYGNWDFLTTIRAPWAEAARTAVLYLDTLLKGGTVPHETVLPVELVPGHTA